MTVSRPFVSLSVQSQVEMWLLFQMKSSFPTAIFENCCLRAESLPWSNAFIWKYNSNCQFCFLLFYFHHLCVIISGRKCVCEQPDVWTFTCHLRCWQHHSPTPVTTSCRKLTLLTNCSKFIKQKGKGILWHFAGDWGLERFGPLPTEVSGICWRPLCKKYLSAHCDWSHSARAGAAGTGGLSSMDWPETPEFVISHPWQHWGWL